MPELHLQLPVVDKLVSEVNFSNVPIVGHSEEKGFWSFLTGGMTFIELSLTQTQIDQLRYAALSMGATPHADQEGRVKIAVESERDLGFFPVGSHCDATFHFCTDEQVMYLGYRKKWCQLAAPKQ